MQPNQPDWLPKTIEGAFQFYADAISQSMPDEKLKELERELVLGDLYYLLVNLCGRKDMIHPWLFARCREFQASPNGHLDLWARNHYKSTIITFGGTIQDVLADPEITVNIFSHVRPIAKAFLNQIKREFESNQRMKDLFNDVLYQDPERSARSWSLDSGLIVKRKTNPKEPTINASGLVDGQPTAMHFKLRVYDDVVVPASVASPEMMQKTMDAIDLSDNLGTKGGVTRFLGTRYKLNDAYEELDKRKVVNVRLHAATHNGRVDGDPVFLTEEEWDDKVKNQGPNVIASQQLQNPLASDSVIFQPDWLRYWPADKELPAFDAVFLSVDGAFSEKNAADDTAILALGLFKAFEGGNKFSVMVLNCTMERMSYPDQRDMIIKQYDDKFGKNSKNVDGIIIEDKSSGSALIPDLRRANLPVYPYHPGQLDKTARANLVSHLVRDGYLWIPESRDPKRKGYPMSWLSKWHEQFLYFPNVKHDDGVDATVQALSLLDKMGYLRGKAVPPREQSYWKNLGKGKYA